VREYEACSQEGPLSKSPTTVVPLSTLSSSDQLNDEEEPRILTFAELKDLIETGQLDQIPNNKVIPNGLNVRIPFTQRIKGLTQRSTGGIAKLVNSTNTQEALGDSLPKTQLRTHQPKSRFIFCGVIHSIDRFHNCRCL